MLDDCSDAHTSVRSFATPSLRRSSAPHPASGAFANAPHRGAQLPAILAIRIHHGEVDDVLVGDLYVGDAGAVRRPGRGEATQAVRRRQATRVAAGDVHAQDLGTAGAFRGVVVLLEKDGLTVRGEDRSVVKEGRIRHLLQVATVRIHGKQPEEARARSRDAGENDGLPVRRPGAADLVPRRFLHQTANIPAISIGDRQLPAPEAVGDKEQPATVRGDADHVVAPDSVAHQLLSTGPVRRHPVDVAGFTTAGADLRLTGGGAVEDGASG